MMAVRHQKALKIFEDIKNVNGAAEERLEKAGEDDKEKSAIGRSSPTEITNLEMDVDPDIDLPPDGGLTAWLVVLSCFLLNFNLLGITYAFGVYQARYQLHEFPNQSPELISFIGAICIALTLTVGIPVARWIDVYGFHKITIGGAVLFSVGLMGAGFCKSIPTLIVTQGVITGVGAGAMFIPANIVPAQWFLKNRSFSIGVASAGSGVGGVFWSFVLRAIIDHLGYRWALWISAAGSALINVVAMIFFKTRRKPKDTSQTSIWSGMTLFQNPRFVTLFCASALSVFGYMVPYFYVPTYAQTQLSASPSVGSILSAVMDIGMIFGRIILGFVADSRLGALNSIVAAMAISGLCHFTFWLPAANSLPLLYIFAFTYGFFGGGYIGLLPAVLVRIFDPSDLPVITGVFFTSELPGELAGGPLAGALYSSVHGNWTPVILYSGLTLFGGSLFALGTRFQVQRRLIATV